MELTTKIFPLLPPKIRQPLFTGNCTNFDIEEESINHILVTFMTCNNVETGYILARGVGCVLPEFAK